MKKKTAALLLTMCLTAVLCACLSGCGIARTQFSKLNERMDQAATAAATFSENVVRPPQVEVPQEENAKATVLVYMNGSNLETESGEATDDIAEMIKAGYSEDVNVVIQTMGTKQWQNYGISSRKAQRWEVGNEGLMLVDDTLGQLQCTDATTLRDFIYWGAVNYPAQRYALILWDHGAGPVYGFGYDETGDESDTLTLDEMQSALYSAGVYFDFIGMDCCLMSSLETCCALYDYCDYTILSEDFESGLGWSYTNWLKKLRNNPAIPTTDLGKIIIDDMVADNEKSRYYGSDAILTMVDEGMMKVLFTAWTDFAYANEDTLLGKNYSTGLTRAGGGRDSLLAAQRGMFDQWMHPDGWDQVDYSFTDTASMSDYYVTDIMAAAQSIKSEESKALSAALSEAIVYSNATENDADLTGLSVTLPYGDRAFYSELKRVFTRCGFDATYVNWLDRFVEASGSDDFFDYSDAGWEDQWSGWDQYSGYFDWDEWASEEDTDSDYWDSFGWNEDDDMYVESWSRWFLENYEDVFSRAQ